MTHHTDAERADFEAWARERYPSIDITRCGDDYSKALAKDYWSMWQAARRAKAAPVPQEPTSKQIVLGAGALLGQPENTADNRHPDWHSAVAKARSVYLAMLAAAPQPPEANPMELHQIKNAAPVQLPEPAAWVFMDRTWTEIRAMAVDHGGVPAYTEQQVRQLLAQHGIK